MAKNVPEVALSQSRIPPRDSRPIGLLAGGGRFPILFAEKAQTLGLSVVCVGIRYEADGKLADFVGQFHWSGAARLGRMSPVGCGGNSIERGDET